MTDTKYQEEDEVSTSENENDLAVRDEKGYKNDESLSLGNLTDGTRLDVEILLNVEEEGKKSDVGSRSGYQERLDVEIAKHGVCMHYPNGDRNEDDCLPGCQYIADD